MTSSRWVTGFMAGFACLALVAAGGRDAPFAGSPARDLSPELEPLRPFLGSWVGHFDDPEVTAKVFATWTEILGGQAIRGVRTVPEIGDFEAETLYYFDRETGTVAYFSVTNNGYVTRGHITFEDGRFIQEGTQVFPDSSVHSTAGTFTFGDDGALVDQGGPGGHTIVYERR